MPRPFTPLVINQFKGEEDSTPSLGETQAASLIQNMYMVNGGLERRLGQSLINTAQPGGTPLQAVAWCRIPNSAPVEYVVGVKGGTFYDYYNAGIAAAPTALTGGSARLTGNSSTTFDMAVVDGNLYAADGTNAMVRFNGTHVVKAGAAKPATAPSAAAGAAGVITGAVAYRVTYIDADGNEGEASDASAAITVAAKQVTVTIPNDTDADRTNKKLYRQGVASTNWLFVATLSASATSYTDNTADGSLGAALTTIGQTLFPSCTRLWEHDNRLFGCGNPSNPNVLYISTEFTPWQCPASPDLTLPSQGVQLKVQGRNATIIGGISHGAYCFIFTDEGGYILQGTSAEDYRIERFTIHGCTSHRTIVTSRNWIFWVGTEGIFRYDGLNVARIDTPILQFFGKASALNLSQAAAWYYNDRYYVGLPSDGASGGIYAGAAPGAPGGGPAPVDPSTLSGVNIYLDGRVGMTVVGGNVTQWSDQSGNARNFVATLTLATAPPQVAGPTGGVNAIQIGSSYDGGTHFHAMDNVSLPTYSSASGFTHYVICKPSVTQGAMACQIFRWTNGFGMRLNYQGAGYTDFPGTVATGHAYLSYSSGTIDLGVPPTGWVLWTITMDTGGTVTVYKNGIYAASAGGWSAGNLITEMDIGGTDNAPDYESYVALYLMLSATHSLTQVKQAYAWYHANYGV